MEQIKEMPMHEFLKLFSKQLAAVAIKNSYNCKTVYGVNETVYQLVEKSAALN